MTEEEKKAIERAKEILDKTTFLSDIGHKDLEILLNLIEKLQKEKYPTKFYACDPNKHKECKKHNCYVNGGECDATIDETKAKYIKLEDYIPKDKVREKIEDLRRKIENNKNNWHEYFYDDMVEYSIKLLKELLEEK